MRVTETEKTSGTSRLTNYKKLRDKYMYHYVAVITKNHISNTNDSGPSSDRYEHNNIKKSDKIHQVSHENFIAPSTADKENKTLQKKPESMISIQAAAKKANFCPRCLVNPKMMCDHCKKLLAHDKSPLILQSDSQKILKKNDSGVTNSCELFQLCRIPSEKPTITSTRISLTPKNKEDELKNDQKFLESERKKSSTIQTTSDDSYYFFTKWDKFHQKPKWIQVKEKLQPPSDKNKLETRQTKSTQKLEESIQQENKLLLVPSKNENKSKQEKKKLAKETSKSAIVEEKNKCAEKNEKLVEKKSVDKIPKNELEKLLKSQSDAIEKEKLSRKSQSKVLLQKLGERAMQAAIVEEVKQLSNLLKPKESSTKDSGKISTILSCGVLESKTDKIIIGEKIVKRRSKRTMPHIPINPVANKREIIKEKQKPKTEYQICDKRSQPLRTECGILYALSDDRYIDNGWTILPTEKMLRKMNVYRMYPAQPEFDWFEQNKWRGFMTYETGDKLAEFEEGGRCRIYYKNGRLALDYYAAEETNAKQRFVVYSNGEPSRSGRTHPVTVLAIFDYLGNGIVLDHGGNARLKYTQTEGVILDRSIGPVSTWQWHSLNDPPDLRHIMIDDHLAQKDPIILELGASDMDLPRKKDKDMEAIELEMYAKEKAKKLTQNHYTFQIKMKALKINENFSLKILSQETIYLTFRDGLVNIKLRIGMILDNRQIIDTDIAELGVVSNNVERLTAATDSVVALRNTIKRAQEYEMNRLEKERLLRPARAESDDHIATGLSRPLHEVPLKQRTVSKSAIECCTSSFVLQC